MKTGLPFLPTLLALIFAGTNAFAQTDKFGFAITDFTQEGKHWMTLRKVDFQTGSFSDVLLDGTNNNMPVMDINGGTFTRETATRLNDADPSTPFASGVAAMAYDRNSNRIYYVPMYYDQLRYVDLKTMRVYTAGNGFGASREKKDIESITRMVIAGDGFGYALSADGNHLYRFSTKGRPVIEDLGTLRDAPGKNSMSILNNACMTGGGDMVADDNNNLYLIASSNQVFRISLADKMATHLGSIRGLPEQFTSNGAAVNHEGKVVLTSSIFNGPMFSVDPTNWEAAVYKGTVKAFNASDLGSSNLLVTGNARKGPAFVNSPKGSIKVYPNPVRTGSFKVNFANMESGAYYLELIDASGRRVMQKKIAITSGSVVETIQLDYALTMGVYMVKVTSENNMQVSLEKVIIEREGRVAR